jgi:peroxiredoxin
LRIFFVFFPFVYVYEKMRQILFHLVLFFLVSLARGAAKVEQLPINSPAPAFDLPGVDGTNHKLADYDGFDILAILFTCNHCPSAQAVESRVIQMVKDYKGKSFQLVAISPNSPESIRINELGYSVYGDTLEDMKHHARQRGFNFPYLYDGETQQVSLAYGVLATPHLFIFDKARRLQYSGRVDDSKFADPNLIKTHDARNAIDALFAGTPVPVANTRPHGCSTKWADKKEAVAKFEADFKQLPVSVEVIDAQKLQALAKNPTPKLRLVNLWSITCGPCIEELPALVEIARQFETRDFELITISTDPPSQEKAVQKLLQRNHVALPKLTEASVMEEGRKTNNFIFAGGTDELAAALDPKWQGLNPYSILIAPSGEIIFRHDGEIDSAEIKTKIVDYLGRFYQP